MLFQETPLTYCTDTLCENVIGAAIDVHRVFGPGLLENFYREALCMSLRDRGIACRTEVELRPVWRGEEMPLAYRIDILVEESLILELKAVEKLHPVHICQLITYLKLMRIKTGFLLNFNMTVLKDGIKRVSI